MWVQERKQKWDTYHEEGKLLGIVIKLIIRNVMKGVPRCTARAINCIIHPTRSIHLCCLMIGLDIGLIPGLIVASLQSFTQAEKENKIKTI